MLLTASAHAMIVSTEFHAFGENYDVYDQTKMIGDNFTFYKSFTWNGKLLPNPYDINLQTNKTYYYI